VGRKQLDRLLTDAEAARLVHSAVEEFAQGLASVIRRFLKTKGWRDTQSIVLGGGFSAARVGELSMGHAAMLLKAEGAMCAR
jgi:hypothetical protein